MPLLDRDTIVDRPVLLDRSSNKEQDDEEEQEQQAETLGNGGGPTINGLEFEPGSYNIVAAANLASVLATGDDDGQSFKNVFRNAAIQLYELDERGIDISGLVDFAELNQVSTLGLQEEQIRLLREDIDSEVVVEEEEDVNIDEIEQEIAGEEESDVDDSEEESEPKPRVELKTQEPEEQDEE